MADPYKTAPVRCRHDRGVNEIAARIGHLSDRFETLIAEVAPGDWDNQSPCSEWTARDVVRHLVEVHQMMLRPLERTLSPAPSVDDDPLGAFRAARADVAAVLADRELSTTAYDGLFGHAVVEETIDNFLGFDLSIHGWDLATATGQSYEIEGPELARLTSQVEHLGDALRTPGVCGPPVEVPADSSAQDKLIALLGRDPRRNVPLA
jgi:uncharacterized protein (TIGR03086 family)